MVDLNIPVGVSDFEKLRENNYYYIDKTGFISKLLQTKSAEVTLITRPQRFGKTLGMRMLASFFDIRKDSRTIFEGLKISKNTALCDEWMNQYPTLFLSFKDYAYTEEGMLYWNYGDEGVSWEYDEDGVPQFTSLVRMIRILTL